MSWKGISTKKGTEAVAGRRGYRSSSCGMATVPQNGGQRPWRPRTEPAEPRQRRPGAGAVPACRCPQAPEDQFPGKKGSAGLEWEVGVWSEQAETEPPPVQGRTGGWKELERETVRRGGCCV